MVRELIVLKDAEINFNGRRIHSDSTHNYYSGKGYICPYCAKGFERVPDDIMRQYEKELSK